MISAPGTSLTAAINNVEGAAVLHPLPISAPKAVESVSPTSLLWPKLPDITLVVVVLLSSH